MEITGSLRNIPLWNINHFTLVWDISNFSTKSNKVGEYIVSPSFLVRGKDGVKWHLELYPFGYNTECESFLSLFLCATFYKDIKEYRVERKFYLWNNNEHPEEYKNINTEKFIVKEFTEEITNWGNSKFLARNSKSLKNHLSKSLNDTLSIACCIATMHCDDSLNSYKEQVEGIKPYFLSEHLSDVTIEIDNKKLKAHKIILSARSKVFSAMFKHNTVEQNESVIKITDISYDVMKEVLRFIYCGAVVNLGLLKRDLLAAADKYDILSLKKICEEVLLKSVNLNNVCETLSIADLHQCPNLKDGATEFIIQNMKEMVDSNEIDKIEDCKLLTNIFRKISQKEIIGVKRIKLG